MKRNRNGMELSKNLLQMKFMQRTKENVERSKREELSGSEVDQNLVELCRTEGDRYLTTNSYVFCEDLRHGRMSFKGMNPEIEKLMESNACREVQDDHVDPSELDVSDREMANHFKRRKRR